jgi:hypothetical protein
MGPWGNPGATTEHAAGEVPADGAANRVAKREGTNRAFAADRARAAGIARAVHRTLYLWRGTAATGSWQLDQRFRDEPNFRQDPAAARHEPGSATVSAASRLLWWQERWTFVTTKCSATRHHAGR